ncbi:craniofacial development protein 2-like [Cydia fagiglandana]|uniref:craniofacial development protein 2-like n=1 Tax=Cydia fagiglandana TaxID=1458189 RepID=UPI002FEE59D6
MARHKKRDSINARAFPQSDVNAPNAKDANRNVRAFPKSDVDKNKRSQQQLRIATWNLGSLTGRQQELAETLHRRRVNICCIQETKWKGAKSRDLGLGYKLVYYGTVNNQNGIGIVLDKDLKNRIINIDRRTDRLMSIKLALDNQPVINII